MTLIDIVVLIVLLVSLAIVSIMKKRLKSLAEWQKDNSSKINEIEKKLESLEENSSEFKSVEKELEELTKEFKRKSFGIKFLLK